MEQPSNPSVLYSSTRNTRTTYTSICLVTTSMGAFQPNSGARTMIVPIFSILGRKHLDVVRSPLSAKRKMYYWATGLVDGTRTDDGILPATYIARFNEKSLIGSHLLSTFPFLWLPCLVSEVNLNHFTRGMILSEHVVFPVAHGYRGVHSRPKKTCHSGRYHVRTRNNLEQLL